MDLMCLLNMVQDMPNALKKQFHFKTPTKGGKHIILKAFFKLHNAITYPVTLSTPTYTHNIDNTQLHTRSHVVGPENAQLHALRTPFLLTLNYTRA